MTGGDPYDELPYKCLPVEWTAPERLALTSLLHGGPRQPLNRYRVLELGCGDGANLLPMAYHRPQAQFVGVDGARTQIEGANSCRSAFGLSNVEFIQADFVDADDCLQGPFDFIIGHGIFSWVTERARDALLRLCARRLRPGGLLYLNYNTNPGWKVRGMVRDFLLDQTTGASGLRVRAQSAQGLAARIVAALGQSEHPYSKLMANEFRFVCDNDPSYIAHEYLTNDNYPFWRREFMTLVGHHGFEFVGDADFTYGSGRIPQEVAAQLLAEPMTGQSIDETIDFFFYRQIHSPILTQGPLVRRPLCPDECADLFVASCLAQCEPSAAGHPMFQHPSGYRVEAKEPSVRAALEMLHILWPAGVRVSEVFPDVSQVMDDLLLLHRTGLIELRCVEASDSGTTSAPLRRWENEKGGYVTTRYHTRIAAVA